MLRRRRVGAPSACGPRSAGPRCPVGRWAVVVKGSSARSWVSEFLGDGAAASAAGLTEADRLGRCCGLYVGFSSFVTHISIDPHTTVHM